MESLATGSWLTNERVSRVAAICAAVGIAMILFLWLATHGTLDYFGQPVATDFAAFWQAGHIANTSDPAHAWDQQLVNDSVRATHGVEFGVASIYPPVFLFIAAPFGGLPYLQAAFLWQLLSLVAIALILKAILRSNRDALVALASPLVPLVLANGQNSLLTAALFGTGLLMVERRPLIAGGAFGALLYKPQLGLVVGPLLLFTKNWRALAGATAAAVALIGMSVIIWGLGSWTAWLESLRFGRYYMEQGSVGFYKSVSLFSTTRNWGAGIGISYAVQGLGLLAGILMLWRARMAPNGVRAAAAGAAAALSTPYLLDYDLTVVGIGAIFLYVMGREKGFLPYEKTGLAFIWIAPLFARHAAEFALLPLGTTAILVLGWFAWRRASGHCHPAIDVERLPGDVTGLPAR